MQRRRLGGLDVSAVGLGPACLEDRIGPPDGVLHLRAVAEQPGGAAARNTRVGVGSLPPGRHHGAHRASSLRMQARGDSRRRTSPDARVSSKSTRKRRSGVRAPFSPRSTRAENASGGGHIAKSPVR
jgi:hypothetical protein